VTKRLQISCAEGEKIMRCKKRSAVIVLRHSIARLHVLATAAYVISGATAFPAYAQVAETVLYSFLGHSDGSTPYAPLIADLSGPFGAPRALYGTTGYGRCDQRAKLRQQPRLRNCVQADTNRIWPDPLDGNCARELFGGQQRRPAVCRTFRPQRAEFPNSKPIRSDIGPS
jgi:hypothetical protein